MTREEQKVYDAAKRYVQVCNPVNFGLLVTAVMDVPMSQWPKGTCAHKPEHVLKSSLSDKVTESLKSLPPLMVHRGPKDE